MNVYLREKLVIGEVDHWLAREFMPHPMSETIHALVAAQPGDEHRTRRPDRGIGQDRRMRPQATQYRAALDQGASPATVVGWITETEAEKAKYEASLRQVPRAHKRMTEQEIRSIVDKLAEIAHILANADPNDKSEIFRQLGLRLTTYHPGRRIVEAKIEPAPHGFFESARGSRPTNRACT